MIWLLVAFLFGFAIRQVGLPPLVGYLIAGFVLNAVGVELDEHVELVSSIGITLMLFTIGLKVDVRALFKGDLWGSSLSHMSIWLIVFIPALSVVGLSLGHYLLDLDLQTTALVGFALSFSSTVCAIKVLEDSYEVKSRQGSLAVRVLIIQDIIAVLFLFFATGKMPSMWAMLLFGLLLVGPILGQIFSRSGHGELVPLLGLTMAFGGAALFEVVDMKGDLGALAMGMLVAGMPKSSELYKSLISFKDIFLIGFFLSIGFTALPTLEMVAIALGITLLVPLKMVLFFFLFVAFSFRARTAFLSSLLLANFSEFGLIVAGLSVDMGWMPDEWLVIIAMSTAFSFVFSTAIYKQAHQVYAKRKHQLCRFQRASAVKHVQIEQPKDAEVIVVGMGRVGQGAYKELYEELGDKLWGVEVDAERAAQYREEGKNVLVGDADDIEFWETLDLNKVRLIMLALPSVNEMKNIIGQLQHSGYRGRIATIARFEDEQRDLIELGADVAFNYYVEVGAGFAEESRHLLR